MTDIKIELKDEISQSHEDQLQERTPQEQGIFEFSRANYLVHDQIKSIDQKTPYPTSCYSNKDGQFRRISKRASYRVSQVCYPIALQCRILLQTKEQKSLKLKKQPEDAGKTLSNQTKNIAKNYGKAIIAFIQKNKKMFRLICKQTSTPYQRISEELTELKGQLTTVAGFRRIWTTYKYAGCMRAISNTFLRRHALNYIFNSKVSNIQTHIKYRIKFLEGLRDPNNFDHIKDY